MAHELSIVDGQAEAFFGSNVPAWHGLGTVVAGTLSSAAAIEAAHLGWTVGIEDIFTADMKPIEGWKRTYRQDTRDTLGVVTDGYNVVQNVEAFDFIDSLLQDGVMQYETAGALRGGRVIWALATIPGSIEVAQGDAMKRYILLSTGHDGSKAVTVAPTTVRVVCANTLAMADRETRKNKLSIRHTDSVKDRLNLASKLLREAGATFDQNIAQARKLCGRQISDADFYSYIGKLYPAPLQSAGDRTKSNHKRLMDELRRNYFTDAKQNIDGIKRTPWAAYNAVTQMIDHPTKSYEQQTRERREGSADKLARKERHFQSVLMGAGAAEKQQAFDLAIELVS